MSDSSVKKRKDELIDKIDVLNSVLANLEKEEYDYGRSKDHELALKTRNKITEVEALINELTDELDAIIEQENKKRDNLILFHKQQEQLERQKKLEEERDVLIKKVKQTKEYIEEIKPFLIIPSKTHEYPRKRQAEICQILIDANQRYKRLVSTTLWEWVKELRAKEIKFLKEGNHESAHVIRDKISLVMEEGTRLSKDFDL